MQVAAAGQCRYNKPGCIRRHSSRERDVRRCGLMTMSEICSTAAAILFPVVSLFFWVRGLVRPNMGDLVAGLAILLMISVALLLLSGIPHGFNYVGGILVLFGIGTYVTSRFAQDNPLFKKRELVLSAVLFVVVGVCGLIVR